MADNKNTSPSVINLGQYERNDKIELEHRNGYVTNGEDNLRPQWLLDLYAESATHHRVIDSLVRLLVGDGLESAIDAPKSVVGVEKFNEIIDSLCYDWEIQGGFFVEVIENKKGEPLDVSHLPYENVRLESSDENDEINGVYYSKDWANPRKKGNEPVYIPAFDPEKSQARSVLMCLKSCAGSQYYPSPSYEGAIDYIELETRIGQFHVNQINNGLFPSIIINWRNGQPSLDEKNSLTRELERKISGAQNAGKFLQTWSEPGTDSTPEIIAFPITEADKQYQFLSTECRDKILLSHGVVSPILFGVRDASGLGNNANEMTEAMDITMRDLIIPERRLIVKKLTPLFSALGISVDWGLTSQTEESDSSQAYSEQQINSLLGLLDKVKLDMLTVDQATTIAKSMLKIDEETINSIFGLKQGLELSDTRPELTDELGEELAKELKKKGTRRAELAEEWELISEEEAFESSRECDFKFEDVNLSIAEDYSEAGEKSEADSGLYMLRYAYSQNLSKKSRGFCVEMVNASKQGYIFRFEDIIEMGESGVNGQFAPQGESTYNIFDWKGGVYCHHHWKRLIYFRKRDAGKFLPKSPTDAQTRGELVNDRQMGNFEDSPVRGKKGMESIAPINTKSRGSLKNR